MLVSCLTSGFFRPPAGAGNLWEIIVTMIMGEINQRKMGLSKFNNDPTVLPKPGIMVRIWKLSQYGLI